MIGVSPEYLLDRHTPFHYVTAFVPAHEIARGRRILLNGTQDGLKSLAALISNAAVTRVGRRFCPVCTTISMAQFGESYWRRTHLLPGVLVCVDHKEMLREAHSVSCDRLALPHDAVSRRISPSMNYEKLASVASVSAALLSNRTGREPVAATYLALADGAGYRTSRRDVASGQISRDLAQFYGGQFLASFGCEVRIEQSPWPALLIRRIPVEAVPLKHVLLRVFLEQAPKEVKALDRRRPGRVPRDYKKLDKQFAADLAKASRDLASTGKTMKAWDLLKKIGAWEAYRHNRPEMPKTQAAVERFRQSPQCSWQIVRKSRATDTD